MVLPRLQVEVPARDLLPDVLILVVLHEPPADVADARLAPIELVRLGLDVRLHVVEQFLDLESVRLEADRVAVAESELDGRALARRLRHHRLEHPPVLHDLVEPLHLPVVAARAVLLDVPLPVIGRLGILPAVLENLRQVGQRVLAVARLRVVGDGLIYLDEVELVGQLEAPDAGGELRDRLVLGERVERIRPALVLVVVFAAPVAAEVPAVVRHRLHAELPSEEVGERRPHLVRQRGVELLRLEQQPAPAFAVALRPIPVLRYLVVDGRAVGMDRRPLAAAVVVIAVAGLVVGQLR